MAADFDLILKYMPGVCFYHTPAYILGFWNLFAVSAFLICNIKSNV